MSSKQTPTTRGGGGSPKGITKHGSRKTKTPAYKTKTPAYKPKPNAQPSKPAPASSKTATETPVPVPAPEPIDPLAPFFCCTASVPLPSTFPPALIPFYTYILARQKVISGISSSSTTTATNTNPPPLPSISTLPPTGTYYRFSHLSLATGREMHRFFLASSAPPPDFIEGSEEEVLEKAGAAGTQERVQDVMIFSRNARCGLHGYAGGEGGVKGGEEEVKGVDGGDKDGGGKEEGAAGSSGAFWFVLMRVEGPVAATATEAAGVVQSFGFQEEEEGGGEMEGLC
ncbi:hypothetical protein ACMFMF_001153 [Clarireedia jacksonii]